MRKSKSLIVQTKSGDITVDYKRSPSSLALKATSLSLGITIALNGFQEKKHTQTVRTGIIGEAAHKADIKSKEGTIHIHH
ncbi:DUF4097 family beta strand repeat-containing protein [Priestia endophytica]|uniref:DUF4097 family beta strand repeat-containing protein n=1 Tax=Priestia endophytica TaxID=135735 RepID=UPI002281E8C3|nr:DUF4097 family beta strand repeat-containing protein [Priestia endophytica]MCY8234734.1 DUF4097 family beta strand repeat-containing protein [Priestia endophytica]